MHRYSSAARLLLITAALILSTACSQNAVVATVEATPTPPPADTPTAASTNTPLPPKPTAKSTLAAQPAPIVEVDSIFAAYEEPPVEAVPAIYHDPIAPDLGNVLVPSALSEEQLARLAKNGIVASPGMEKEFFTVYEQARYANVPIFVTSDSVLHVYHLLFDKVLRTTETMRFLPDLRHLNQALVARADELYQQLPDGPWREAAHRTVAFITVGGRLADPDFAVPDYATELVEAELSLIEAADGIHPSPLFPGLEFGEDYTQYIPRGHYTGNDDLKAYFKSMMWYGRMTFRLKTNDPEVGRAETRSALLLTHTLRTTQVNGQPAFQIWADLYNPTAFLVGQSDDLTVLQYLEVMDTVYGSEVSFNDLVDEKQLDAFIAATDSLPPPRILGLVIGQTDDEVEVTKGLRLMGQRFVPDAYIFRQLVYRNVGTSDNRRGLPNGLDLMAALGSKRAYEHLEELGETEYDNYPTQMEKMRTWVSG